MRLTPVFALAAAAALASLTASSSTADVSAVAPSSTISVVVPSGAATFSATSETTAPITTEPAASSAAIADACQFATDSVLITAMDNSAFRSEQPMSFDEVRCSSPFAVARTSLEDGRVQAAGVLFKYDFDTAEWTALDTGSAMSCAQYGVTPEREAALEGCGS